MQYFEWMWNAVRFDFGHSFWTRQPVIEELGRRYPMTANLAFLSVLEVLREDYARTARSKGVRESLVLLRHALKNALLPVVTISGVELLALFGGFVVLETVFTIPGIGRFLVDAITHRDDPSTQALIFVFAAFVQVVNLLVDIVYAVLDPRIRYL